MSSLTLIDDDFIDALAAALLQRVAHLLQHREGVGREAELLVADAIGQPLMMDAARRRPLPARSCRSR